MAWIAKIWQSLKRTAVRIDMYIIIPFSQWIITRLSRRTRTRLRAYRQLTGEDTSGWKDRTLEDFRDWIEGLPDMPSPEAEAPEACDLFTLLAEFSALRQEIRLQSRQQSKSAKRFDAFVGSYRETTDLLKNITDEYRQKNQDIASLESDIRKDVERNTAKYFLDVRDALRRGLQAARTAEDTAWFRRKKTDRINGMIEGYEMTLRRFDRALAAVNVFPIEAMHQPFNPATMKAVETREASDVEKGIVIEEQLGGFMIDNEILRTAEVVVSK